MKQRRSESRNSPGVAWLALGCLLTLACSFSSAPVSDPETERRLREAAEAAAAAATTIARIEVEAPAKATEIASAVQTAEACVSDLVACAPDVLRPPVSTQAIPLGLPLANARMATNCDYGQGCAEPSSRHTGIDYYGGPDIVAAGPGTVVRIQRNDKGCNPDLRGACRDHGLGNTMVLEHTLEDGNPIYTLYAHLAPDSMNESLLGKCVAKGDWLATIGATGYGLDDRWGKTPHLHFEVKTSAVLGDPKTNETTFFGYVKPWANGTTLDSWGYRDPELYLGQIKVMPCS